MNMTRALEDYLEAIYFLTLECGQVRITDLAEKLSLSKPSVSRAVSNLKKQNLVEHESYGLLKLTDNGYVLAKEIADRHSTLKKFLHNLLGVDEKVAEEEACRLEHSMCNGTIDKLRVYLKKVGI